MPRFASHTHSVPPSGIRRVFELAKSFDDVTYLLFSEPDAPGSEPTRAYGPGL